MMIVSVHQTKEYTTVWLRKNYQSRLFRCHICMSPILKYAGNVEMLVPGIAPVRFPLEVMCSGTSAKYGKCPAIYVFEGIVA